MPRDRPSPPPPLPVRRAPLSVAWRAALWRGRFAAVALCLGVAAAAAVGAVSPTPPATVPVVVAAHDVDAGTPLAAADVEVRRLPTAVAPARSYRRPSDVVGSSTAVPLATGLPVVAGVLVPDDVHGPTGTVVAAVRFADPAVAGLLRPGLRVDVVAATPEGAVDGTVAVRALVLPVPAAAGGGTDGSGLLGGAGQAEPPPVLLAVSPDEATALAGAAASALLSPVVVP
ncbi:SAF domain-containing protein [Cellulomonas sp. URHB0016]